MAERLSLEAEPRSVIGKKVKQLRREGIIPAVIYGQGEPKTIQLDNKTLRRVLRVSGQSDLLNVQVGSQKHTVLVRDIQQHVTRGDLIHIDFWEVNMNESVTTTASLVTVNKANVDSSVGTAVLIIREIDIEALPDDLVSEIEVDLSLIQDVNDHILVEQLTPPPGITILTDPEALVANVRLVQVVEEEEEEEEEDMFAPAADAVEVIPKGKDDDEEF